MISILTPSTTPTTSILRNKRNELNSSITSTGAVVSPTSVTETNIRSRRPRAPNKRVTFSSSPNDNTTRIIDKTDEMSRRFYTKPELEQISKHSYLEALSFQQYLHNQCSLDCEENEGHYEQIYYHGKQGQEQDSSSLIKPYEGCSVDLKIKALHRHANQHTNRSNQTNSKNRKKKKAASASTRTERFSRGLENLIFPEISRNRQSFIHTVLKYQSRGREIIQKAQRASAINDADGKRIDMDVDLDVNIMKENLSHTLSMICVKLSRWSMDKAHALAQYDAASEDEHQDVVDTRMSSRGSRGGSGFRTNANKFYFQNKVRDTIFRRKIEACCREDNNDGCDGTTTMTSVNGKQTIKKLPRRIMMKKKARNHKIFSRLIKSV